MYLVDYLMEVGPVIGSAMGASAINWQDLLAWEEKSCADTRPWEARLLISLSKAYLAELRAAEKPGAPMPWLEMGYIIDRREQIGLKAKSLFGNLAFRPEKERTKKGVKRRKKKVAQPKEKV